MSFGASLSDITLLLQGLEKIVPALKNEAVDLFKRYKRKHQRYVELVNRLKTLAEGTDLQDDHAFNKALRRTRSHLESFFRKISAFEPSLGANRGKKSWLGAIAKIKWMSHARKLAKPLQDLDGEVEYLFRLVSTSRSVTRPSVVPGSTMETTAQTAAEASTIATRNGYTEYYIILVTRPPIHCYGVVSDTFCTPPDQPSAILWDSTSLDHVPPMLASLHFRRHFALCLVPRQVWGSQEKTLAEKFKDQLFWDYNGDSTSSSRGTKWSTQTIREINAMQNPGLAAASDKTNVADLCTEYYITLKHGWGDYYNIWWNAGDFALCLAYLLVGAAQHAQTCHRIMQCLVQLRTDEVTQPRFESCQKNAGAGVVVFLGGLGATVLTGGLAAPIALPMATGGWLWAAASGTTGDGLIHAGKERLQSRRAAIARLQELFPKLDQLFS